MKKIISSLLFCFLPILSLFAIDSININKEMYCKENLRLRSEQTTSSKTVTVMRTGSRVKILEIGKEESIDSIKSNWVKIEVLKGISKTGEEIQKGTKGWCYGGYLTDFIGKYDYIDLTDNGYQIEKIQFKSKLDETAWKKLAGFYFLSAPHETITEPEETDTEWGKDYTISGHGSYFVEYKNGIWTIGGDGEASDFELKSISEDENEFLMENKWKSEKWTISGEYLIINGQEEFYKYTGPDCYKKFLRQFVKNYKDSVEPYKKYDSEISQKLEIYSDEILKALATGDIKTYAKYSDKKFPVQLKIGDYRDNQNFSYIELTEETDDVKKAFDFMKTDLQYHKSVIEEIKPVINEFLSMSEQHFKQNYPEADFIVEYIFNRNEEVQLLFKVEGNQIVLIGLNEYACFRA